MTISSFRRVILDPSFLIVSILLLRGKKCVVQFATFATSVL